MNHNLTHRQNQIIDAILATLTEQQAQPVDAISAVSSIAGSLLVSALAQRESPELRAYAREVSKVLQEIADCPHEGLAAYQHAHETNTRVM